MADPRTHIRLRDILDEIEGVRDHDGPDKNLPVDLKAPRPEVPCERIRALGNFLRYEYASIDNARIWSIVTEHLQPLEAAVRAFSPR